MHPKSCLGTEHKSRTTEERKISLIKADRSDVTQKKGKVKHTVMYPGAHDRASNKLFRFQIRIGGWIPAGEEK